VQTFCRLTTAAVLNFIMMRITIKASSLAGLGFVSFWAAMATVLFIRSGGRCKHSALGSNAAPQNKIEGQLAPYSAHSPLRRDAIIAAP